MVLYLSGYIIRIITHFKAKRRKNKKKKNKENQNKKTKI